MAPQNNTAVNQKPHEFFKILLQDSFASLMIPRKFCTNLPNKLSKLATLFSPSRKFWHVKISCIGQNIYFEEGWSEFAEAHDLQTGNMVVFRYVGNMIFKVKVFDMTGCLKDYSLGSHVRHAPTYVEIETSSESRDETPRESSCENKSAGILKKRKLANEQAHEVDKRKKGSTPPEILHEKETRSDSTFGSRQFESILRPYCFAHGFMTVPKAFCVNNGLLGRRTMYLKKSAPGEKAWPVLFHLGDTRGHLSKGWKVFREAAALKEEDSCIFRLTSENLFVVDVIQQKSNSTRERKGKDTEDSTSTNVDLEKKQTQRPKQCSRTNLEWESTVRRYHLTQSYQSLGELFCRENKLATTRDVTLRDLTGKEWCVKLYKHATEGRLCGKGWIKFSSEYGLKAGDRCIFKLLVKDTLLVRVVKSSATVRNY